MTFGRHFLEWSYNYRHYIDEWYDGFAEIFIKHNKKVPSKKDFYRYCYINSFSQEGYFPEIIPTPEIYMENI